MEKNGSLGFDFADCDKSFWESSVVGPLGDVGVGENGVDLPSCALSAFVESGGCTESVVCFDYPSVTCAVK